MLTHFLRRLGYSILVLFGVATVVFLLFNVLPEVPGRLEHGQPPDLASVEATRKALHLDKPLLTRYGLYLNDLSPIGVISTKKSAAAHAGMRLTRVSDSSYLSLKSPYLGRSYRTKRSVAAVLGEALPTTLVLALTAMLFAMILGIGLGMLAALKKDTLWDTGAVTASVAGISMPTFFVGLIIAYIFGYLLSNYTGLIMTGGLYEYGAFKGRRLALHNLILPAFALGIRPMAIITLLTRSAMLDVLSQDYIRTAYAKGLSKTRVMFKHALPNALNLVVTATSGWLAELLAGSFFIEYVFGWNGIGKITVDALERFDLPLVMGAVLITALIFIIVNLLTDLLSALLDPRVRFSQ